MRNCTTLEFIEIGKNLNDPDFKGVEFDPFEKAVF